MEITLKGLTADELLKIAKVLTDESTVSVEQTESVGSVKSVKSVNDVLTVDKEGLPWDERIHTSNHQMTVENRMPMLVFGLNEENSIVNTMSGKFTGTKVTV